LQLHCCCLAQVRVFCRVKPHMAPVARCLPDKSSLSLACDGKEQTFRFDRVFGPESRQEEVFSEVSELVQVSRAALALHWACCRPLALQVEALSSRTSCQKASPCLLTIYVHDQAHPMAWRSL
jgi:hypothetical protein